MPQFTRRPPRSCPALPKQPTRGVRHFPSPSAARRNSQRRRSRRRPSPGDERLVLSAPRLLRRLSGCRLALQCTRVTPRQQLLPVTQGMPRCKRAFCFQRGQKSFHFVKKCFKMSWCLFLRSHIRFFESSRVSLPEDSPLQSALQSIKFSSR